MSRERVFWSRTNCAWTLVLQRWRKPRRLEPDRTLVDPGKIKSLSHWVRRRAGRSVMVAYVRPRMSRLAGCWLLALVFLSSCGPRRRDSRYPFIRSGDHDLLLLADTPQVRRDNQALFERFSQAVNSRAIDRAQGVAVMKGSSLGDTASSIDLRVLNRSDPPTYFPFSFAGRSDSNRKARGFSGGLEKGVFVYSDLDSGFYLASIPAGDARYAVYVLPRKGKTLSRLLRRLQWRDLVAALGRTRSNPTLWRLPSMVIDAPARPKGFVAQGVSVRGRCSGEEGSTSTDKPSWVQVRPGAPPKVPAHRSATDRPGDPQSKTARSKRSIEGRADPGSLQLPFVSPGRSISFSGVGYILSEFLVDRPFVLLVLDERKGSIEFISTVNDVTPCATDR